MDREITVKDPDGISLLEGTSILFISALLIFTIIIVSTGIVNAQTKTDEASTTATLIELDSLRYTEPVKTDFEVLSEQAEKIATKDLLISKYAQKLDALRISCGK